MRNSSRHTARRRVASLDHELGLVGEAIAMVASGGSPRVILAGLRHGVRLVGPAQLMALGTGVTIVPLRTADERLDIEVQRSTADANRASQPS